MKWPSTLQDAREIQMSMKDKVMITELSESPFFIAGVDASYSDDNITAVACLYTLPELEPVEDRHVTLKSLFPYVPGLLSFREGPAVIKAVSQLKTRPDLILCDGQGIAHPQGLGIASHIGLLMNIPSIGCAKSRLVGEYHEPGRHKGQHSPLWFHGKLVGAVLRTRDHVRPVFISPGHLIDLESSLRVVLACTGRFRIPEPLRRADRISREHRKP